MDIRRGLTGHWRYHGSVAATGAWYDLSGNGNAGTLVDNAYVNSEGVNLDGTDYVKCASTSGVGNGSYTISARIKNIVPTTQYQAIFAQFTSGSAYPFLLYVKNAVNGGYITLLATDGTTPKEAISDVSPVSDTWYHVVGTNDGSYIRIYVDKTLKASTDVSGHGDWSNSDVCSIGARDISTSRLYAAGIIDDVQIFNRALSADEIKQIYYATKGRH